MKVQAAAVPDVTLASPPVFSANLARFTDLHEWMIIPMVIMQLGIFIDHQRLIQGE